MTALPNKNQQYPSYEDHREAWEELANGIASIRHNVAEIEEGSIPPNSRPGRLTIIGTGIETIGVSLGDKKLIEEADKILYCVADPATIVWLKQLRPDALDLYVLYGEDKQRYVTYMQMTEAQLYWVRQGLNVVVVFYGHPGVFVLSTHRAIKLARREGYKATMKAGVCALDTLCADLGVDPCHPGLQTHEATDCLIRRRRIDPSLHVVLWQVGLIGEMGYRRHGYLNSNFSYFVNWLQEIYGIDYPITHYIGSRYPTIDPLIEIYPLSQLHEPNVQEKITGLSTFYLPPRDVIPTDLQTVKDLGILKEGQRIVTPSSPLREIGKYGPREMAAFDAFANFNIPASYKWQRNTEASNFLISLRFDTALQDTYREHPESALDDERFRGLSDQERSLLASRDAGAIQVASKGNFLRDVSTEEMLSSLLNQRSTAQSLFRKLRGKDREQARDVLNDWAIANNFTFEWSFLSRSLDYLTRNHLFPWTGVYLSEKQGWVVTLIGNRQNRNKSLLYLNGQRIRHFKFINGTLKWAKHGDLQHSGFFRFDVDQAGLRRIVGKIWSEESEINKKGFSASETLPYQKNLAPAPAPNNVSLDSDAPPIGKFAIRTTGDFRRRINIFEYTGEALLINGNNVASWKYTDKSLHWSGAEGACDTGTFRFLIDPVANTIECYGKATANGASKEEQCYGSIIPSAELAYGGPPIPDWASDALIKIVTTHADQGGLLLWHKWEKYHYTSKIVNKYLLNIL